jgi:integral membrane protein
MQFSLKTPLSRFRVIGILEGISFLVLLGIAMPLKYLAGWPHAVKVVGWAHGVLFIAYIIALIAVTFDRRWSITRVIVAFIASLVPFGTFWLESRLKQEDEQSIS